MRVSVAVLGGRRLALKRTRHLLLRISIQPAFLSRFSLHSRSERARDSPCSAGPSWRGLSGSGALWRKLRGRCGFVLSYLRQFRVRRIAARLGWREWSRALAGWGAPRFWANSTHRIGFGTRCSPSPSSGFSSSGPAKWPKVSLPASLPAQQLTPSDPAASPFLISLGLSKSSMSFVFMAGPLSGLIVQPLVGVLSDSSRSTFGRRRPFIFGGCVVSSLAVLLLGWAREVAALFTTTGTTAHSRLTITFAILSIYVMYALVSTLLRSRYIALCSYTPCDHDSDFSINVVQAMDRSLLVDVVPPHLQAAANAWASRMFGIGAVAGYWIGGLDLPTLTGKFFGEEQLKVLTFFTAFFLCATHAVTVFCVTERVLISKEDDEVKQGVNSAKLAVMNIWTTLREMPRPIQQVLNVQVRYFLVSKCPDTDFRREIVHVVDRLVSNPLLLHNLGRRSLHQNARRDRSRLLAAGNARSRNSSRIPRHVIPRPRLPQHVNPPSESHRVHFSSVHYSTSLQSIDKIDPISSTQSSSDSREGIADITVAVVIAVVVVDTLERRVCGITLLDVVGDECGQRFVYYCRYGILLGCYELVSFLSRQSSHVASLEEDC